MPMSRAALEASGQPIPSQLPMLPPPTGGMQAPQAQASPAPQAMTPQAGPQALPAPGSPMIQDGVVMERQADGSWAQAINSPIGKIFLNRVEPPKIPKTLQAQPAAPQQPGMPGQ